jgi:pyruvate dehydrogenase E1 component alpha subunit
MDKDTALSLHRQMLLIRRFEEKLFELFSTRIMPGTMHQYNGQEAVAVGVCAHLEKEDYITSTHRGHGHCLAKGATAREVMAEMFAKTTGCCKGLGGSMHIADFGVGMLGANGIVAGGIPMAVGAGWSCRYRNTRNVAVSFFGDGAANEGAFHEALNLAATWSIPVVFVCENNLYGFSTHYKRTLAVENIADRASGYGMEGAVVDGMDVEAVYDAAGEAITRARDGQGPTLLECKTYRFRGHSRFEDPSYRTKEELAQWQKRDPIEVYPQRLESHYGLEASQIEALENEIADVLDDAVAFAETSADPEPNDYRNYIYA